MHNILSVWKSEYVHVIAKATEDLRQHYSVSACLPFTFLTPNTGGRWWASKVYLRCESSSFVSTPTSFLITNPFEN